MGTGSQFHKCLELMFQCKGFGITVGTGNDGNKNQAFQFLIERGSYIMCFQEPVMGINIEIYADLLLESLVKFNFQSFNEFAHPPVSLVVFLAITDKNVILVTLDKTGHFNGSLLQS